MIDAATRCSTSYRSPSFPFTASQWQELEQQALVFRYLVSGVPVPPDLISTVITSPLNTLSSSRLFPLQQQSLPIGWGCFQVGYGRKVDPEPGRCRRTDGKKWRCSKEAYPDSKYCERHMHRGKSKAKKLLQFQPFTTTTTNTNTKVAPPPQQPPPPTPPPTMRACVTSPALSCSVSSSLATNYNLHKSPSQSYYQSSSSLYPFLSPNSPSSSNSSKQPSESTMSTQNHAAPLWLLDPESYYDQPNRDIRYLNEMKGGLRERMTGSATSRIKLNSGASSDCSSDLAFKDHREEERLRVDVKEDDESKKKAFHHFLGDGPMKNTASWVDFDHNTSRSYKISTPVSSQPYYKL